MTSDGYPVYRIGTTSATTFVLEECSGCALSGWGWNDNGYGAGVLGRLFILRSLAHRRFACRAGRTEYSSIRLFSRRRNI